MMYPFMTLDDNTMIAHSEKLADGQIRVCIEQPIMRGFKAATCMLPSYQWSDVEGFSEEELKEYQQIIEDGAHLIYEYSETGGFLNASGF
ncbi:MAG: hypothetical protein MJ109_03555 [Kiritimatiellae bacterium]|nr:hypothetical protein [Kiritimatiellia bacterium]